MVDNEGIGREWLYTTPRDYSNVTGGEGNYATADGYYYWDQEGAPINDAMDTELHSPSFNPSNHDELYLNFKSFWYDWNIEKLDVDIKCGAGSWMTIWNKNNATPYSSGGLGEQHTIDITSHVTGQTQCNIRFHYYDASAFQWQIDDVAIHGPLSQTGYDGSSYSLPANQWRMVSLPRNPRDANAVVDLFGDDIQGAGISYDNDWVLYRNNEDTDLYEALAEDSVLNLGQGYWIYSTLAASLDVAGLPSNSVYTPECPTGCFEIPLTKASNVADSHLYNMLGHPFDHNVQWADVRLRVESGGSSVLYTPSAADSAGYLSKNFYKYNGASYDTYHDIADAMQGTLEEFDGFFVKVLGGAIVDTYDALTLLIPASNAPTGSPSFTPEESASPASLADAPEKDTSSEPSGDDWHVRLTVEDSANNLKDRGNVLGQLSDSEYGYDLHDLDEPLPMSGNYLSLVFPHVNWGERAGDYTSDFHPVSKEKQNDSWQFEIRTNDPQREITLSWASLPEVLKRSKLIDEKTGKTIRAISKNEYRFVMNQDTRRFTWIYLGKKK